MAKIWQGFVHCTALHDQSMPSDTFGKFWRPGQGADLASGSLCVPPMSSPLVSFTWLYEVVYKDAKRHRHSTVINADILLRMIRMIAKAWTSESL